MSRKLAKIVSSLLKRDEKPADANTARKAAIFRARGSERLLEDRQPAHKGGLRKT
jgi:hypothetical protein